jgi:hypothetical protein
MTRWVFADANHTTIKNTETGAAFHWPRHAHISNVAGAAAEEFRNSGCPWPEPYNPEAMKVQPATQRRA